MESKRGAWESEFGSFEDSGSVERDEPFCEDCDCEDCEDCDGLPAAAAFGELLADDGFDADGVSAFTIGASTREIAD